MRKLLLVLIVIAGSASSLAAQDAGPHAAHIKAAVAPLPEEFRASAKVLGYENGKLVSIREGNGAFICLADDPSDQRFHTACYQKDLEPFMARGRELRAMKVANVDSARFAEIDARKLTMPSHPAALYSLTGKLEGVAPDGTVTGARQLYVVYIPFATSASTGIAEKPAGNTPWIMFPGTAKAHIMFVPTM